MISFLFRATRSGGIIPNIQMRKLRPKLTEKLAQGHTTRKQRSQYRDPGLSDSKPHALDCIYVPLEITASVNKYLRCTETKNLILSLKFLASAHAQESSM